MISKMSNKEIATIAGVISGLAYHFKVDPFWLKFGFILAFFFTGPVILIAYVVLAIIMPKEYISLTQYETTIEVETTKNKDNNETS